MKRSTQLFIISFLITINLLLLIGKNITKVYEEAEEYYLLSEYITYNLKDKYTYDYNNLVFKGNPEYNYVKYNNMEWRIIKVSHDGSIELILNDYINILPQDMTDEFLAVIEANLDLSYLVKNKMCIDDYSNDYKVTCQTYEELNYVNLVSIYDYINSLDKGKSFIQDNTNMMWFLNKGMHSNKESISISKETEFREIKVVVTLKNDLSYTSGDGSKENPFIVGSDSLSIGSIVKLNEDYYYVFDTKNSYKLMSMNVISGLISDNIYSYLNDTLYNSLSYKDSLNELVINNGDILNIYESSIVKMVGIPSVMDIKFDSKLSNYYLANKDGIFDLIYNSPIIYGDKDVSHGIRYTISLSKDIVFKNMGGLL